MAYQGWILHTGAAQGADQNYAMGAFRQRGRVMLHLPWDTYERDWVAKARATGLVRCMSVENSPQYNRAESSVFMLHPNTNGMSRAVILLHARNYNIICPELDVHVRFVVAFPGPSGGGTMQGVRIADAYHVPVVRLDQMSEEEAKARITELAKQ